MKTKIVVCLPSKCLGFGFEGEWPTGEFISEYNYLDFFFGELLQFL